ncbi:MAG: methionine adenosyltransferase [Holosporales bacterium]
MESVSAGHPDKVCDQISDALVDAALRQNSQARVAIETLATTNQIVLAGEIGGVDLPKEHMEQIVRQVVRDIGYEQEGFHWQTLKIDNFVHAQSTDIAQGVVGDIEGAGDQGLMFGFACLEAPTLMPAALYYAHKILENLVAARAEGLQAYLGPDAKSQVVLRYDEGKPVGAESIVLSTQHKEQVSIQEVRDMVAPIIRATLPEGWMCREDKLYINPTGRFVIGGPAADTGLTGRKIIVDTYGGYAPHGGGAFSGKDPSKVDRSAAYMMRYLAKNIVASGLADRATVQVSYAIGKAEPLSFYINTHGTGKVAWQELYAFLMQTIDLTPRGIRNHLKLDQPIYQPTATYGHFGRAPDAQGCFSWEKLDLVSSLQSHFNCQSKDVVCG